MITRGRLPDGLFLRHPEAEQDQGLPLVGLVCLLAPTTDPEAMARRLVPQLALVELLPVDGAVVPLWTEVTDVWPCDLQARQEVQARLAEGAEVVVVARVDGAEFRYRQLDSEMAAYVCATLSKAMGDSVH